MRKNSKRRRPSLTRATLFLSLLLLAALFVSGCTGQDEAEAKDEIREVTRRFFSALAAGDTEAVNEIAPSLNLGAEKVEQLSGALAAPPSLEDAEVRVEGNSAFVEISLPRAEGSTARLTVPVRKRGGTWVIYGSLEVTQTYDFVPLEDEE